MNKYFQYFLAILVIILGASVTLNTVDEYISRNSDVALRNIDASIIELTKQIDSLKRNNRGQGSIGSTPTE